MESSVNHLSRMAGRPAQPLGRGMLPVLAGLLCLLLIPVLAPAGVGTGTLEAQERVEEVRSLDPDGRLTVSAVRHAVVVQVWDRDEVEVVATIDPDREEFRVSGDARDLSVQIEQDRGWRRGSSEPASMEIRVPAGIRLEVATVSGSQEVHGVTGSVRMSSTSGSHLLEASPSSADLNVVSGSVRVRGEIPQLRVNAVSGRVEVEEVEGRVEVSTVSGSIRVAGGGALDQLRAKAVSGSIEVAGSLASQASVELETHSGGVTLHLPASTPASYELDTMSGSIRNGISADEARSPRFGPGRSLDFQVGDGTARVRIQTFSGSIRLEDRG